MASSILGKISKDGNAYDHVSDMVLTMNSNINPQIVLAKLSELIQHKNTKNSSQKEIKGEASQDSAFLMNSNNFPYKITYLCRDGKHNTQA
ncbi:hypothetical protein O181_016044 [Austropuccinia psidii MF-1]|uniref:Uncharacterized protein n=1 Tax=Austropuccinia psidii MF-1 TaxID=1389203 RepID=A0A9Q3C337_9BASI|nr:hypothetical protein [Austropuccinia psidii MF-1]